jgi:hypothetical protein
MWDIVSPSGFEVSPPERLIYPWTGGGVDTRLIWTLKRVPEGTNLTLDHTGFKGLPGVIVSGILGKGWRSKILTINLPALLDRWSGSGPVTALSVTLEPDTVERSVSIPQEPEAALTENREAAAVFDTMTYSRKKEYVDWILNAKQAATKANRVAKAVDMLAVGKKRPR